MIPDPTDSPEDKPSEIESSRPTGASAGIIKVTADELAAALKGRPADQCETLEWFRAHCVARSFTWLVAANKLHHDRGNPYSRDSVYLTLTGRRPKGMDLAPICKAVERYRANVEAPLPDLGFVWTKMAATIDTYLLRCRDLWRIGFIIGDNGSGKTTTLEELERRYAWLTKVRMSEGGSRTGFLQELSKRRGFGSLNQIREQTPRLMDDFEKGDQIAVDEADECFGNAGGKLGRKTLTFMRRFYDERRVSLVLVMDTAGFSRLQSCGADDPLRRLYSRRLAPLFLPAYFQEDLDLFAQMHGLPPAPDQEMEVRFRPVAGGAEIRHKENPKEVEAKICASHLDGLAIWLGFLKQATTNARAEGKEPSWGWVIREYALHLAMGIAPKKGGRA